MKLSEGFMMAVKNITTSKMRSFLTMLGIIIGVLAVILIVGLGNGLSNYVTESFASMGTDRLTVAIMGRGSSARSVSDTQMYEIVAEEDLLEVVSPTVSVSSTLKVDTTTLDDTTTTGINEEYLITMLDYELSEGRNITYMDTEAVNYVAVVGSYVDSYYYNGNSLGETLRINGQPVTIVGVLAAEDDDPEAGGTDDAVYLPYTTAARINGTSSISSYSIKMVDETLADESQAALELQLYTIFGSDDSYMVISPAAMLDAMTSMIDILVSVLVGIAAISLLVGGIGIMNIMLVSVTERTREIGVRKSLGAREKYIMQQFVIEAAVTATIGGLLGIVLGYVVSFFGSGIASDILEVDFTIDPGIQAALLAFGISAGIGILFGYLPAKKAAVLNPIDALRL